MNLGAIQVDIDPQAVEVTKLSLLLKVLEGETADKIARQMDLFKSRVLPDLGNNIKCGNSLISSEFLDGQALALFSEDEMFRVNVFDWEDEFPFLAESNGFGAVVGNPPWISLSGKFGNKIHTKDEVEYLVRRYSGNSYMPNMYEYFVSKGLELTEQGGLFSFIVPDRFGSNDQFVALRKKIVSDFNVNELLYRAPFPGVVVDTLVFNISAATPKKSSKILIGNWSGSRTDLARSTILADPKHKFEFVEGQEHEELINKICGAPGVQPLSEIVKTTSGIGAKSKAISADRLNSKQIKILKGADVNRYEVANNHYFDYAKPNITGRTTDTAKLGFSPKVLIRKTGNVLIAAYDDSGVFPEQSLYFTYGKCAVSIHYLLGVLNSNLMNYVFKQKALTNRASMAQVKKVDLDALPIMLPTSANNESVEEIVEAAKRIVSNKQSLSVSKSSQSRVVHERTIRASENSINRALYRLFGLTAEEVSIIENFERV